MTIEGLLRRRANRARYLAAGWGFLAALILVAVYITLPIISQKTLAADVLMGKALKEVGCDVFSSQLMAIATLCGGLIAGCLAAIICARSAAFEIEIAIRLSGLADALCIAGSDLAQLERAAVIFVPKTRHMLATELLPVKELKPFADLVKQLRP